MTDLVIRGATVVDGLGNAPRRADVAVKDGRIDAIGDIKAWWRQDDRRRRADALARHHRRAHALRRAGDVGRHAVALAVARRHHRGDGQLRLRHRAGDARRPRPRDPQPLGRRGHGPRRAAHRHQVGLRELRRLHGDAAPPRALRQRGRAGRPFDHPHRRDGRGGLAAQGCDSRGTREDEGDGGRRHGQRRDRARRVLLAQPFGLRRRADALDHRADGRARRAGRRDGPARQGRDRHRLGREDAAGAGADGRQVRPAVLPGHRHGDVQRAGAGALAQDLRRLRRRDPARQRALYPDPLPAAQLRLHDGQRLSVLQPSGVRPDQGLHAPSSSRPCSAMPRGARSSARTRRTRGPA